MSELVVDVSEKTTYERFWLVKDSDWPRRWVKCHRIKCCRVQAIEKLTLRGITNGIKAYLTFIMVWFEDEPGES